MMLPPALRSVFAADPPPADTERLDDRPRINDAILATRDEFVRRLGSTDDPGGIEEAWLAAVQAHIGPAMRREAEVAAFAVATASEIEPMSVSLGALGTVVSEHMEGMVAFGPFMASVVYQGLAGPEETRTLSELVEPYTTDRGMEILADRVVNQLWNGVVNLVLASGSTIVAQGVASDPFDRTKQWNTMLDNRVRAAHAAVEGQTVPVSGVFQVGGSLARYPGDPTLPPGLRINCRCFITPGGVDSSLWLERMRKARDKASGQQTLDLEKTDAGRGVVPADVPGADPTTGRPSSGGVPDRPSLGRRVLNRLLDAIRRAAPNLPLLRDRTGGDLPPGDFAARWVELSSRPEGEWPRPTLAATEEYGVLAAWQRALLEELGVSDSDVFETVTDPVDRTEAGFIEGGGEGDRRCSTCAHYQTGSCAIVEGEISAGDVCGLWQARDIEDQTADDDLPNDAEPVSIAAAVKRVAMAMPPGAGVPHIQGPMEFLTEGPEHTGTGIMVCVRPTPDQVAALTMPGGVPAEEIHLTLGYFGSTETHGAPGDDNPVQGDIEAAMSETAEVFVDPIGGEVSTVAVFEVNEERPLVALIDAPGLSELWSWVLGSLEAAGYEAWVRDHGFQPHITLGYEPDESDEEAAAEKYGLPVTFSALELSYGEETITVPFGQPAGEDSGDEEASVRSTPKSKGSATVRARQGTMLTFRAPTGELMAVKEVVVPPTQPTGLQAVTFEASPEDIDVDTMVLIDGAEESTGGIVREIVVEAEGDGVPRGEGDEVLPASEEDPVYLLEVYVYNSETDEWDAIEGDLLPVKASEVTVVAEFPTQGEQEEEPETDPEEDEEDARTINERRAAAGDYDWEGILVVEGVESGDRRVIAEGGLTWRDLPLTLMAMFQNPETGGHALAVPAGSIWEIERVDGATIVGRGFFDTGPGGVELRRMMDEGTMKGVSVDIDMVRSDLLFEDDSDEPLMVLLEGRIMGATATAFPAFQEAVLELIEVEENQARAIVASGAQVWSMEGHFYAVDEDGITDLSAEEAMVR